MHLSAWSYTRSRDGKGGVGKGSPPVTGEASGSTRGHRKCSSGINKAIVDYGSDIAPELRRAEEGESGEARRGGRGRGEEQAEGWRKGRVKMGRAVSVIAERRR